MRPPLHNMFILKFLSKLLSLIKVQTLIFLKGRVKEKKKAVALL